ncbi:hypothetical protein [Chachezhania sediminis]|uniref:hypothetical protein n=1 Tax=Chachezhania sediminis TaxID=2599291 RepID=UPI00131ADF83|nr:hypothetical protein [Chachezhania sediminis]
MQLSRRGLLALLPALTGAPAFAHHGWRWTDENEFELIGVITKAEQGALTLDADGQSWRAGIGRAGIGRDWPEGLTAEMLEPGTEVTLIGRRDVDQKALRMTADRMVLDGTVHDLDARTVTA